MENLGERIRLLRVKNNLTQSSLAKKLKIDEKTIFEIEEGVKEPNVSLVASISEFFNVSIEYLVNGENKYEAISLDDMDSEKRALYLIKKDDVELFDKYGYLKSNIFITDYLIGRSYSSSNTYQQVGKYLNLIYEYNSRKIFNEALNIFLKEKIKYIQSSYIFCDLDRYIKMCCNTGNLQGIKAIDAKFFMVNNKVDHKQVYFPYNENPWGTFKYQTYVITLETLKYALNPKTSTKEIIDYFCDIEFINKNSYTTSNKIYFMVDYVVSCLYENNDEKRICEILPKLEENNKISQTVFNGIAYYDRVIQNNGIYYRNPGYNTLHLKSLIYPLNLALDLAIKKQDIKYIKIFSDYNKHLADLIPNIKTNFVKNEELDLMKVDFNHDSTDENKWTVRYVKYGILNAKNFLNHVVSINNDNLEKLKDIKQKLILKIKPFLEKNPIHKYELIMKFLEKSAFKELFEYAIDSENEKLEKAVLLKDRKKIIELANSTLPYKGINNEFGKIDNQDLNFFSNYKKSIIDSYLKKIDEAIEQISHEKEKKNQYEEVIKNVSADFLKKELKKGHIDNLIIKLCARLEISLEYLFGFEGELSNRINEYIDMLRDKAPKSREIDDGWGDMILDQKYEDDEVIPAQEEIDLKAKLLYKLRINRNNIVHSIYKDVEILTNEELKKCIEIVCNI